MPDGRGLWQNLKPVDALSNHALKVILIGGSSHVGKSQLAKSVATTLGWTLVSTDSLARHPGRPWQTPPEKVPNEVAVHYLDLSVDELIEDVLNHYRANVWPKVEAIIDSHTSNSSDLGVVIEGSAVWPEFAGGLDFNEIAAVWLTASDDLFRQRIYAGSNFDSKAPRERRMIDKFLERTLAYNARMVEAVNRLSFNLLDVEHSSGAQLTDRCLSILGKSVSR